MENGTLNNLFNLVSDSSTLHKKSEDNFRKAINEIALNLGIKNKGVEKDTKIKTDRILLKNKE